MSHPQWSLGAQDRTAREFVPGSECPCGCGITGSKLSVKTGHVARGCKCRSCIGRRNRKAGQASERRRHLALGGTGRTPADELATSYSINVTTQDKHGAQVPASFVALIDSAWFRKAMKQAEDKMAIGFDAMPAVWLEPPGKGPWLLVKIPARGLR